MKPSSLLPIAVFAALQASSIHASIIDSSTNTLFDTGKHANLQGLEWLSLDVTAGLSRSAVETDASLASDGWRFATRAETELLVTSLWGGTTDGWSPSNAPGAIWFHDNFGTLALFDNDVVTNNHQTWFFFGDDNECSLDSSLTCTGAINYLENAQSTIYTYVLTDGVWGDTPVKTYTPGSGLNGYINDHHGANLGRTDFNQTADKNFSAVSYASLLVREANAANGIPAPTTLALLGLGMAGLWSARRRKLT